MNGFSIEELRKNNKVVLTALSDTGIPKEIYTGYLMNGFSFGVSISDKGFDTSMLSGGSDNTWVKAGGHIMQKMAGIPLGVDMRKLQLYGGSKSVSFKLDTFLYLKESYNTDIANPLNSLMDWCLPSRDKSSNEAVSVIKDKSNGIGKNLTGVLGELWTALQKIVDEAVETIGEIYTLVPPPAFTGNNKLQLKIGKFTYEDVFVKDISIQIPQLFLYGGLPDHVKVSFNVETLRVATKQSIRF